MDRTECYCGLTAADPNLWKINFEQENIHDLSASMSETVSNLNSVNMDEATVFKNARDRFFQHLSSEERAAFTRINSPAELLLDFKRLQTFIKDDSRWMKVFSAVKNCSDQLQPYFDIVGIVIQSHPEWAAIAWGALRLVLQVKASSVDQAFRG